MTEVEFDKHLDRVIDFTGLTPRQEVCLRFICRCLHRGFSPSLMEIAARLDLSSTRTAHLKIAALVRKGKIIRTPRQRRIEIPGIRWVPQKVDEATAVNEEPGMKDAVAEIRKRDHSLQAKARHKREMAAGILIVRKWRTKRKKKKD